MNKLLNIPMIIFLVAFITLIVVLIVITNKKQKKYKQTIEKLDYEKNKFDRVVDDYCKRKRIWLYS